MSETRTLVVIGIFLCYLFYFIRRKQDSGRSAKYSDSTFATSNQDVPLKCQHSENSRKYHKDCMLAPSALYPVLITGLGGGGTHNVARLMGQMGALLPHEELGYHGSVVRNIEIFAPYNALSIFFSPPFDNFSTLVLTVLAYVFHVVLVLCCE